MYQQKWIHGCRVTVSDWIGEDRDGQTPIRIGVEYFKPGSSLSSPIREDVLYCPRCEEPVIKNRLDSIVFALISRQLQPSCIVKGGV